MAMGKPVVAAAQRRALYLEILRRRARPGSGSTLALLRSRGPYPMPDLNALLAGVRYVVVGGTATSLYMPMRATEDVDVLIAVRDAALAEGALRRAGARLVGQLSIGGTSWRLPSGEMLDVLTSHAPWIDDALDHPNRDAAGLPIIALPYLVLLKLEASRGVDIGDLTRMLGGAAEEALAAVRAVVRTYLPDAAEDLEGLIQLGRLEYAGAPGSQPPGSPSESPAPEEVHVREHHRGGRLVREHWRRRPSQGG
jgi:hypothetical protein